MTQRSHFAFVVLVMGGLLLWQLSVVDLGNIRATLKQVAGRVIAGARRRKVLLVGILLASLLAAVVLIDWKVGGFQGQPAPPAGTVDFDPADVRPSPAFKVNPSEFLKGDQSAAPKPYRGTVLVDPSEVQVLPESFIPDPSLTILLGGLPGAPVSAEALESWNMKVTAAHARYPDFDAVTASAAADKLQITPAMQEAILESELGADLAYWLGKHPDECRRIAGLSPASAARELGRVEAGIADGGRRGR